MTVFLWILYACLALARLFLLVKFIKWAWQA